MATKTKKQKTLVRNLIWSGIIVTSIALIITVIDASFNVPRIGAINPKGLWYPLGFWANIWTSLSTFTIQSNILVLVFFILALINYFNKNKFSTINQGLFKFAVTIYISITLIIFWAALFMPLIDNTDFSKTLDVVNFLNTFLEHLFTPVIMIVFYFVTSGTTRWTTNTTLTKALPISISYMFVYLAYALIKGTFVGQVNTTSWGYREVGYSYPYFFLNVKENLGTFFMYFFLILLIFIGLFAVYYFYNNWKFDKNEEKAFKAKQKPNQPMTK